MTPEQIEQSKVLAVFMGYTYYGHNDPRLIMPDGKVADPGWKRSANVCRIAKIEKYYYLCRSHTQLPYIRDYNALMPVWFKFRDMTPPTIPKELYDYHNHYIDISRAILFHNDPLPAFTALSSAITWLNEIKNEKV